MIWPLLLIANLLVPLMVGSYLLRDHGALGVGFAVLLFAIAGWILCVLRPDLAKRLMFGAAIVALAQFFPVLQILAGWLGVLVADSIGHADINNWEFERITSEFGGFLVATVTGSLLVVVSLLTGHWIGEHRARRTKLNRNVLGDFGTDED